MTNGFKDGCAFVGLGCLLFGIPLWFVTEMDKRDEKQKRERA